MSLIDIKSDAVRARAQEIEDLRQSDMETLGKVRALVLTLEEHWKGRSEEAFVNKYLSQQSNINEFYNTLLEFTNLLKNAADKADRIDIELLEFVNKITVN